MKPLCRYLLALAGSVALIPFLLFVSGALIGVVNLENPLLFGAQALDAVYSYSFSNSLGSLMIGGLHLAGFAGWYFAPEAHRA